MIIGDEISGAPGEDSVIMKIEQRSAAMGPASIFYRMEGDGPPVILIHGLAASSR
jgi:hypothetical protein